MASAPHLFGFSKVTGGGHVSRSMMYLEMRTLVRAMSRGAAVKEDFAKAIVDDNILDKPTLASRKKSLRHLTELYGLDPSKALFRVLWNLAQVDLESLPQLCLVCAYARDPQLRQSFDLIHPLRVGELIERATMERHIEGRSPGRFSPATRSSLAQNVNTTWTYLTGLRGERLLDSAYAALVASNRAQLQAALALASARGLLSLKQAAGIVEFDFSSLLTPAEQALLHESN
jgi:hypothetical protein